MCVFLQNSSIAYAIYNDEVPESDSGGWKRGHTKGMERLPSYYFLPSKVVDSIYLSICISKISAWSKTGGWFAWSLVCCPQAAASALVWQCLCCVEELLGLMDPLFPRIETPIGPFGERRPHHPERNGNSGGKGILNINPSKPSLWVENHLPRSWKHWSMQLKWSKTLNKYELQWRSKRSLKDTDGVCPAWLWDKHIFQRCVLRLQPRGWLGSRAPPWRALLQQVRSSSLCCFPGQKSLVWGGRCGVDGPSFPLHSHYMKGRKMSSGDSH